MNKTTYDHYLHLHAHGSEHLDDMHVAEAIAYKLPLVRDELDFLIDTKGTFQSALSKYLITSDTDNAIQLAEAIKQLAVTYYENGVQDDFNDHVNDVREERKASKGYAD